MSDTLTMRASDRDRQEIVDRLRGAVDEGRLTLDEYLDRMGLAYQAVTYADLTPLCADLPGRAAGPASEPGGAASAPPGRAAPAADDLRTAGRRPTACGWDGIAALPVVLRVLWGFWLTAVSVNVVVWLLVTITSRHFVYPWPLWVAGPYGALLYGISAAATQCRRNRSRRNRSRRDRDDRARNDRAHRDRPLPEQCASPSWS